MKNSDNYVFMNGDFLDSSLFDNFFNQITSFGYAAFEGIRAYNTHNGARLFKAKTHFKRLKQTCLSLGIDCQISPKDLIGNAYDLLEKNRLRNAYVKAIITKDATVILKAEEWNSCLTNNPLRLTVSDYERPNPKSMLVDSKIAGFSIHSVLAAQAAKNKGFDDALLLDMNGNIAQASTANIFIEKNHQLYTPPEGNIFPGITRSTVYEICKSLSIKIEEKEMKLADIQDADSAFLCGTKSEVTGVSCIDSFSFPEEWDNTLGAAIQHMYINRVLEQENYEVII